MSIRRQEAISALKTVSVVTAGLERTWFGKDGWGDCGMSTHDMISKTQPGAYYENNERLFDEELIHALRHNISLHPDDLKALPDRVDLTRNEDLDYQEEIKRIGLHMGAAALFKVGILVSDNGVLSAAPGVEDASHYLRGDIRRSEDRQMHEILADQDLPTRYDMLSIPTDHTFEEPAEWWNFMLNTLDFALAEVSEV